MNAGWIYPFIILGGALQTCGAAMNAQLFQAVGNKWLANAISFALILAFFACVFAMFPQPLPTSEGLSKMPWWAPGSTCSALRKASIRAQPSSAAALL